MNRAQLADLLAAVQRGACPIDEALARLRGMPYEDLDFAKIDHHRALRNGFPEVVLGEGKTPEQIVAIAERLAAAGANVLVTRLAAAAAERLVAAVPGFEYHAAPRLALRRGAAAEPPAVACRLSILKLATAMNDVRAPSSTPSPRGTDTVKKFIPFIAALVGYHLAKPELAPIATLMAFVLAAMAVGRES